MTTRIFLTSAATAALLSSVALTPAYAQKGDFLESRAPWSVTKVAAAGSSNPYCAMAKQFGKDVILTVARNSSGENSFAIDFQTPRFSTAEMVDVALDAGAGQQRTYRLQPVSSKAFVIRLGQDQQFFDALKKTGYLRFEIAGQSYSFNLADIDAGSMKLDGCISASTMPVMGAPAPSIAAAPAPVVQGVALADAAPYRQEIDALRTSINDLQAKNQELSARINQPPPAPEISGEMAARMDMLKGENVALRTQLDQMKGSMAVAESNSKSIDALQSENIQLKEEMNRLKTLQAQKASTSVQTEESAAGLKTSNQALQTQIKQIEEQKQSLDSRTQDLEEENRRLKEKLAKMHDESAQLSDLKKKVSVVSPPPPVKQPQPALQSVAAAKPTVEKNTPEKVAAERTAPIKTIRAESPPVKTIEETVAGIAPQAGDSVPQAEMTEAQRQEQNMMRAMQAPPPPANRAAQNITQKMPEQKIVARASQDPFAEMEIEDDFSGYALNGEGRVVENTSDVSAPAPRAEPEIIPPPPASFSPSTPPVTPASAQFAAPAIQSASFDGAGLTPSEIRVRQKHNMMSQTSMASFVPMPPQNELMPPMPDAPVESASFAPADAMPMRAAANTPPPATAMAPVAEPVPQPQAAPATINSATANSAPYRPQTSIQDILTDAGILNGQQVELVAAASDQAKTAYQWKASDVYGSAVQEPLASNQAFDEEVREYLQKTEERCAGDFAIMPDNTKEIAGRRIDSYEIACVSPDVNSSASLVFFSIDGTFTAVAHETPTAQLQTAMEIRDRLVRELSETAKS